MPVDGAMAGIVLLFFVVAALWAVEPSIWNGVGLESVSELLAKDSAYRRFKRIHLTFSFFSSESVVDLRAH